MDGGVLVEVEASEEVVFEEVGRFQVGGVPHSVAVGEFNGDGIPDLTVANTFADNVSVLLGEGDGSFGSATNFDLGDKPYSVAVGEFNGDGIADLITTNGVSDNVSVLLGEGDGSFGQATNFGVGDGSNRVAVADFNGDGISDFVVSHKFSYNISVFLGEGDGSFSRATNFDVQYDPGSVAVGEFNGDGIPDFAVMNHDYANVSVLLGKGDGSFSQPTNFDVGDSPELVTVGEFNGDGISDLVVTTRWSYNVSVLLGEGDGSFSKPTNFDLDDFSRSAAVEDFNGDGFSDLVLVNYTSRKVSVLSGEGDGSFGRATNFDVGIVPRSVAVEDFNRDGIPDFAVANGASDNISILINKTPITTTPNITPNITISDTKITESNTTAKFTVTLDNSTNETVKVNYTTANQTAKVNQDYKRTKGTLTFQPGETEKTITVPIVGDNRDERNEKFKLNLSKPQNAKLKDKQAIGTILDNDEKIPQISIGDAKVTEGNKGRKNIKFEVELNDATQKTVKVNYATADGTAKSGQDFQKKRGVLTFKPGQKQKTISIPVLGDTRDENNEEFEVNLSRPKNAKLSDKKAVGTIVDNDEKIPQISIGDAKVTEGNKGRKNIKFEVELNDATQKAVRVSYATADGTAKSGQDFQQKRGVLTFKPGQKQKTISIPVLGDTRDENNEQFEVNLSRPKNAQLSDKNAVGIIRDNDKPKRVPEAFKGAENLGVLSLEQTSVVDDIGFSEGPVNRDTEDYFRFEVEKEGFVSVFVDGFVQDLKIDLYDEDESLISQSDEDGIVKEAIEVVLDPGVYYLEVSPVGGGRTKYNLNVNVVEL
jgi:uncharacterized protein YcfL/disulfide oxidoreductase YuzD